jgi:glycosyltransferase involved in cell wall biosynthesis
MKASKIFVTPSDREGFGITILEANACGLPVITADAPGNAGRHLISAQNGALAPLEAQALAKAIIQQLGRPASERTDGALASAAAYDWGVSAQRLPEAYGI